MNTSIPEPLDGAVGTIITHDGCGYPLTRAIGGWVRPGWNRPYTWAEVLAWHQEAIDEPDDDTTEPFSPVVMVPATPTVTTLGDAELNADVAFTVWEPESGDQVDSGIGILSEEAVRGYLNESPSFAITIDYTA